MFGLGAMQARVLGLRAGQLQQRLGLLHVRDRGGTALVEILIELQRMCVVADGLVQQLLLDVQPTQA